MTSKIYIRKQAVFVSDNVTEIAEITDHAIKAIEEAKGAVEEVGTVIPLQDGPNAGNYVRILDYAILKQKFDAKEDV